MNPGPAVSFTNARTRVSLDSLEVKPTIALASAMFPKTRWSLWMREVRVDIEYARES
jgi:hypothetical protein